MRRYVPIHLGCCREPTRCLLCGPPRPLPDPETVAASIAAVRVDHPEDDLAVRFFGGAPPSPAMLDACGDLPRSARVRPDLLTRADAAGLRAAGVDEIELDALTFHDDALKQAGRHYRRARVIEMLRALRADGFRTGVVLAPGLPATDADTCRDDADLCVGLVDTARLHPVLVLAGSRLETHLHHARYEPLSLGAAVTVCREMAEILESGGVRVVRIGLQPAHDGAGRAVAGPRHPALRQLVDARRASAQVEALLTGVSAGTRIHVRCAPADETVTRGPLNAQIRAWRAAYHLADLRVVPDATLPRGAWRVEILSEEA